MNRPRLSVVFSLIAILAMALASCTQPTPEAKPEEKEEPAPEATPAAEEKIILTVWDFGGSEFGWLDSVAIPAFQEAFPNIEINHVGVPEEELGLKLETAIAAKEVPDLAIFVPSRVVKAGHILYLDDYMKRDGLSRNDYCPLFQSGNIIEDKVYSLPIDTNIWAMMYNKDLFAEAGLPELGPDDIINYDDWLVYAEAVNKPADTLEDRVWGSAFFEPAWNAMNNYMSDPYILGDDGRTCVGNAETNDWLHFWEIALTAYDEDLTTATAGALLADVEEDMFTQGKLGMTYATLGDAIWAQQSGINTGLTGQPVVSDGWEGNVGGWNTNYSILAATEHPEEAWQFLKWLSTEAPKIIPLGTDALDAGAGGGLPGLPCYAPLLEYDRIADMIESEPLVADGVKLMQHVKAPPFTVDIWGSVDPFYEAFRRITEDREDIAVAVGDAAQECQDITDELWEGWDALSE